MNYKIIQDEKALREFINWLPECQANEQFYVTLFSRKKYSPNSGLINDKQQLKRLTSTKGRLFDKIKQLECEVGSYKDKNGVPVPEESLALYITPNPRDLMKASKEMAKELINRIVDGNLNTNPKSLALDKIQTACGTKRWYDFDIDRKDLSAKQLKDILVLDCRVIYYRLIEGRGGYHLLIDLKFITNENWHQNIVKNVPGIDMKGDLLCPVPGTCQGGYIPKLL